MDWCCQHLTPSKGPNLAPSYWLCSTPSTNRHYLRSWRPCMQPATTGWYEYSPGGVSIFLAVSAAATVATVRRPRQGHHRGTVVLRHSAVKSKGCCAEYTKRGYWHERAQRPSILRRQRMASGQLATGADGGQFPFFRVVTVAAILESP